MTPSPPPPNRTGLALPYGLLLGAFAAFATLNELGFVAALAVGAVGATLGLGLRASAPPSLRAWAPVPPLVALGALAASTVPGELAALFGGLVAVVYLLWLAEDPDRLPGGLARAVPRVLLPVAGVGLAWASSFLLPAGVASAGVAAVLLVGVVVAVALLVRSPRTFDREAAASS